MRPPHDLGGRVGKEHNRPAPCETLIEAHCRGSANNSLLVRQRVRELVGRIKKQGPIAQ
jgi:hypothetical protein